MFYKFYMHFLVIVQRFEHFYVIALYKLNYYYLSFITLAPGEECKGNTFGLLSVCLVVSTHA